MTGPVQPTDVASKARLGALEELKLRQARRGKMYVADSAFEDYFAGQGAAVSASMSDLWFSQLNLWVQGDVVRAINEANDNAIAHTVDKEVSVLNSAVRKLLEIKVERSYTIAGGKSSGGGAAPVEKPGGGGFGPGGGSGFGPAPGGGPGGFGPMPGGSSPGGLGASSGSALSTNTFTGHVSNQGYDVIEYSFKVIMPARCIPALEASLMKQNFHTVLKVQASPLAQPNTGQSTGADATAVTVAEYYGPDSLLEVNFECELLLLTAWERGTLAPKDPKNPDKTTWTLAPLVPREVLGKFLKDAPAALREEDKKDLKDLLKETPK